MLKCPTVEDRINIYHERDTHKCRGSRVDALRTLNSQPIISDLPFAPGLYPVDVGEQNIEKLSDLISRDESAFASMKWYV